VYLGATNGRNLLEGGVPQRQFARLRDGLQSGVMGVWRRYDWPTAITWFR